MIVDMFNRRAVIAKYVREMNACKEPGRGGVKLSNVDAGFEGFGETEDVSIGDGAVIVHCASSMVDDDPVVLDAVERGDYFQMPAFELRSEL